MFPSRELCSSFTYLSKVGTISASIYLHLKQTTAGKALDDVTLREATVGRQPKLLTDQVMRSLNAFNQRPETQFALVGSGIVESPNFIQTA